MEREEEQAAALGALVKAVQGTMAAKREEAVSRVDLKHAYIRQLSAEQSIRWAQDQENEARRRLESLVVGDALLSQADGAGGVVRQVREYLEEGEADDV